MSAIKLRFQIEPQHMPDSKDSVKSIRKSEISGLCTGIGADLFENEVVAVTISSVEELDHILNVAKHCYIHEIMDASILFSSIMVERIINIDNRMQQARIDAPNDWLNLNPTTLRRVEEKGLPIKEILDSNESLKKNKFIHRRNKITHGEYKEYKNDEKYLKPISTMSSTGNLLTRNFIDIPAKEALDQFKKCSAFVIAWVKQNPVILGLKIE